MISAALADEIEEKCGPLVKWLRQRPLTPLTSVRIRYGSPAVLKKQLTGSTECARIKWLEAGRLLTINDGEEPSI